MVAKRSGPMTANSCPSFSPAATRLAMVMATPLTWGRHVSATMQIMP